jgi:hypothetical protein
MTDRQRLAILASLILQAGAAHAGHHPQAALAGELLGVLTIGITALLLAASAGGRHRES